MSLAPRLRGLYPIFDAERGIRQNKADGLKF